VAPLRVGFCPTEGGHFYREALAEVLRGEELGLDSVWIAEHHGVRDHYWPAPIQVLTGFATRTSRLLLGANVAIFPFYHPVRLAEEVALLDVISGGRCVAGLAIGYKPDEFALYGAAREKRGARFEDGLALMKALWTRETVTHRGPYFTVEDARIEPRPITRPHPPVWIGGWGELALKRAALLADAWLPGPTADLARLLEGRRAILAHRAAAGLPPPAEWPITRELVVADTDQEARELAERHLMLAYGKEYGGTWQHPFIDAATASDLDRLAANRFLIGTPDRVIRDVQPFIREYGMTHLICRLYTPRMPHDRVMRQIELLAREIAPALR
jgi:alkanesulfonate monooxygenase SsuD/methylene tetrahydromethanopterin reductase-like flavin-dependent oxidoreductase (luciferase family)